MSFEALNYVQSLEMERSTDKFVLFCLANHADEDGVSYPSHPHLMLATSMDRKTIILCLQRLAAGGHITDTGMRKGETRQITIWRILGIPAKSRVHYTYRVADPITGEFYIGKRSCDVPPDADPYRGSGIWPRKARAAGRTLVRDVLAVYATEQEAALAEMVLIRQHQHDPGCRNMGTPAANRQRESARRERGDSERVPNFPPKAGDETVPFFPGNSPVFPTEESRFSRERVPKTGHGTITEPPIEPSEHICAPPKSNVLPLPQVNVPPKALPTAGHQKAEEGSESNPPPHPRESRGRGEAANKGSVTAAMSRYLAEFEAWYATYPRKKSRDDALKAYAQAIVVKGATPQDLIAGLRRQLPGMRAKEPEYLPYPATWLRDGAWRDEPDRAPVPAMRGGL